MIESLRRLLKPSNRSLIRELVVSDFKIRYQGSVLGYLWSLLRPMLLFSVLYIVFTKIVRLGGGVPYYPAYLLLGIVLWTFFTEATVNGMHSITSRGDLIRKVNIPKYTIVISTTLSAFINFCLNMLVVVAFMLISQVPFRVTALAVPFFCAELVALSLAISFLLAALYVKFRDFGHIWEVALQVLFYATPIIYPLSIAPANVAKLLSLNPLTQIFQDIRSLLITPETLTTKEVFGSPWGRWLQFLVVILAVLLASWYFRRSSRQFAEEL